MLRIATHRATAGMQLALPVLHPARPGHVLLKPGAILEDASLQALRDMNVTQLWIRYPATEFLLKYADPLILHARGKLVGELSACFDIVAADMHADFEFSTYSSTVRSLVERIVDNNDAAIFLGDIIEASDPLLSESTTVCFISLLMGLKLDAYLVTERARIDPRRAQNVENLGLGALFHDIGMLRLSPDVRNRWITQQDENDPDVQRHVTLGFDTVRGKIPATASAAVLHHHQRLDGSGFPKRQRLQGPPRALSGSEIHVFARIVGMAEVFERFRNPPASPQAAGRLRASARPTVRALRRVLDLVRAGKLDPVAFKALLTCVPAYAPGTFVTLSDGRSCVATGFDPTRPCRPTVAPVKGFDVDAGELELGEPIDLRGRPDLFIAKADGQDVAADNFEPGRPGEFDLRLQFNPSLALGIEKPSKSRGTPATSTTAATTVAGDVSSTAQPPTSPASAPPPQVRKAG